MSERSLKVLGSVQVGFPDQGFSGKASLNMFRYELEEPKYDVEECQQRDMTYAAPLKVTLRLIVFDIDEETGSALGPRHQRARRLHGRYAFDDRQRYLSSSTVPSV